MAYRLLTTGSANPVPQLQKSGSATITAGNTSVTVSHGLSMLPEQITIAPDANISAVGENTFTISILYAQATDVIFQWFVTPSMQYVNTGNLDGGSP